MSLYPDISPDPRKETLLTKSPFTKIFLDPKAVHDPMIWVADLKPHSDQIDQDMEKLMGKDWGSKGMAVLAIMASKSHVFNPDLPPNTLFNIVNSVVKVGWELGNPKDRDLIFTDLSLQLKDTGALNPSYLNDNQSREKIVDILLGLTSAGIYCRTNWDKPLVMSQNNPVIPIPSGNDDVPPEFKDFLDKLNF